jgi:3-deoxy-D-manno-octulosonic-acid transferase
MIFVYNVFIYVLKFAFLIGSFFSAKIQNGLKGRQNFNFENLKNFEGAIWFHVASYGEFEQVKYFIHSMKKKSPSQKIIVTFFSPSGYLHASKNNDIDAVFYLPFDTKSNAIQFLKNLKPSLVFWVRYEFWFHYLDQIKTQNIPLYLINGVFSRSYHAFYALYLKNCLSCFKQIFVINESSKKHLEVLGFSSRILADTRYDRMQEIVKTEFIDLKIEQFINGHQTIVCGSTWYKDERLIHKMIAKFPNAKWILVPHEVHSKRVEEIANLFKDASFYSKEISNHSNVLVIDAIGMLSKMYRYADICYVGGGFDKVVHSVLEPVSYLKPVLSGPHISKSEEALLYQKNGFLELVHNYNDLDIKVKAHLENTYFEKRQQLDEFLQSQLGSTEVLIGLVLEELK